MILAGLRRLAVLVGAAAAGAALLGLALGLLLGLELRRGLAIGFYICGVGTCSVAVVLGSRPPVRGSGTSGFIGLGRWSGGAVRWATHREHREAMNVPAILVVIGVALIAIGVAVDDRN